MNEAQQALLADLLAQHAGQAGALLPLLHALQDSIGHIPPAAVAPIAQSLNLSRAEVHGVISYYHHFRQQAPARHVLQVCCAESCQACGSSDLLEAAKQQLAGRDASVEPVYCLGLCAASPAVQLDGRLHARVQPDGLRALLANLEGGA